jgi:hypothetical protein
MSDGIGMNHEGMKFSLVSRELIADSIEAVVHGLAYDGLIGFGGCDKTLPGVMMGLLRCNVPAVFIYSGSALPGRFADRVVTILDSYEGVGAVMTGAMDEATLVRLERSCLPTIGACAGQFTAYTMAMVSEALGLSVANVSMIPGAMSSAPITPGAPAPSSWKRWGATGQGRATSSLARRLKAPAPLSPRPEARPTPRCTSRRLRTRPASVSTSMMWTRSRGAPH